MDGLEWSDERCRVIASQDHFPATVIKSEVQKNIIDRFINFYLGGKRQKGLNVTDLVFSTISIMPICEDNEILIWKSKHYKDDGKLFYLTPEDRLQDEIKNLRIAKNETTQKKEVNGKEKEHFEEDDEIEENDVNEDVKNESTGSFENLDYLENKSNNDIKTKDIKATKNSNSDDNNSKREQNAQVSASNDILTDEEATPSTSRESSEMYSKVPDFSMEYKWFTAKRPRVTEANIRCQYGPKENSAFISSCNKLLEKWDTDSKSRITLKYFFGIIALVLMRATTKKYMHLVETFAGSRFLNTIDFANRYIKYSMPHKRCIKSCYRIFRMRDGNIPIMFAKLVENSSHIDSLRQLLRLDGPMLNMFKVAVLAHTADYGLGLIGLIGRVENLTDSLKLVVETTFCKDTAMSWHRIKNFLVNYKNKVPTHRWARVISGEPFKDFCCSKNYALSVILATFIEKLSNSSDVWESSWVENDRKADFHKLGLDMFKKYEEKKKQKETKEKQHSKIETGSENPLFEYFEDSGNMDFLDSFKTSYDDYFEDNMLLGWNETSYDGYFEDNMLGWNETSYDDYFEDNMLGWN